MANHGSANVRETPHSTQISRTNTIVNALTRRARVVLNDESIDPQSRAIIRYALETHDPWLARLVRRAVAGEAIIDNLDLEETPETNSYDSQQGKIDARKMEALTEIICRAGDEPETKAAALLVLMARVENSRHPKVAANIVKHLAFIRCGELNLDDLVDSQIAAVETELLARNNLLS